MSALAVEERRLFPRTRALFRGRIVFNHSRSVIDCTMRNHSDGGAMLAVASAVGIPDQFDLRVGRQAGRTCRVRWRKADAIGVEFTSF